MIYHAVNEIPTCWSSIADRLFCESLEPHEIKDLRSFGIEEAWVTFINDTFTRVWHLHILARKGDLWACVRRITPNEETSLGTVTEGLLLRWKDSLSESRHDPGWVTDIALPLFNAAMRGDNE